MRKIHASTVLYIFACVCLICEVVFYMIQERGAQRRILLLEYSEEVRKKAAFLITVSMVKLGYLDEVQVDDENGNGGDGAMTCHLPKLVPFNLLAFKYTWMHTRASCSSSRHHPQIFTSSLSKSIIRLEDPAKHKYKSCCYTPFHKIEGEEKTVEYLSDVGCFRYSQECIHLGQRTEVDESVEFARVTCVNKDMKKVPVDFFGFIHPKNVEVTQFNSSEDLAGGRKIQNLKRENSSQKSSSEKARVNVVIFMIDSMSHMHFQRAMTKSFEYLKTLGAIGLNGYVKVGENTFPNLVPILTGLTIAELQKRCWPNRTSFFDDCPFIWKNYSSQGYLTAYGEDAPFQSAFLWHRQGFKKPPTDYYWNPLMYQMDFRLGHKWHQGSNWCYGPRLGLDVVGEFLKKMAYQMKESQQHYFQFGLSGSLTHGILNGGKVADKPVLKLLKRFQKYHLNDTVLILMSDHGIRFGDFRSSLQGRIEEQMPFIYFLFPPWFSQKPEFQKGFKNLKNNEKRLTTHFDLYETLLDLLFLQNITNERVLERHIKMSILDKKSRTRGISLFLPIPTDRNCEDAGIPQHYCVCDPVKEIPATGNSQVWEAAQNIVVFINKILLDFSQCHTLILKKVRKAYLSERAQRNGNSQEKSTRFSLVFSTLPNNATFEGTTTKEENGSWSTSEELSRVDFYGNQSWCIEDYNIKRFCYCK